MHDGYSNPNCCSATSISLFTQECQMCWFWHLKSAAKPWLCMFSALGNRKLTIILHFQPTNSLSSPVNHKRSCCTPLCASVKRRALIFLFSMAIQLFSHLRYLLDRTKECRSFLISPWSEWARSSKTNFNGLAKRKRKMASSQPSRLLAALLLHACECF